LIAGPQPVHVWFKPWKCSVKLDAFHFMRRFNSALHSEHHPLFGTFCSKLSSCIFEWDEKDVKRLREAKKGQLQKEYPGHEPTDTLVTSSITSTELKKHCRRRTRGVEETRRMIQGLLDSMMTLTDTMSIRLINSVDMEQVWEVQQKHLACIQDKPGVEVYVKVGELEKGGEVLDVLRCARGSSSLESFHRHQCNFIPGKFSGYISLLTLILGN
jgi:hypothetical protein